MDLIDRQDLIAQLNECLEETDGDTPIVDEVLTAIKWAVEQMPTVEPKRGEWVEPTVEWMDDVKFVLAKCSACGNRAVMDMEQLNDTVKFARNFCGNCGADMRGEEDD